MSLVHWIHNQLSRVKNGLKTDISEINTASIIIGATAAIVISAAIGPIITGGVAHGANNYGIPPYQSPDLSVKMTGGDGYTIPGEDLEEFGEVEYNRTTAVYELRVSNPSDQPLRDVDISTPLPGCVIDYTEYGAGSEIHLTDYVSLDLRGQSEGLDVYSCSKTISAQQLDPGDSVSVRFLLRTSFDECDLLQGVGTENLMSYNYQWRKNGIQFSESGNIGMGFTNEFRTALTGFGTPVTQGKTVESNGVKYTNYILVNATNIPDGMGTCRLKNG